MNKLRWVLLLALLLPSARMVAQSGISYGQTVTGKITNDNFRAIYNFVGRQGDIIDVTLTRTDGNLDPLLILTDDQNDILARDDDSAAGYDAALNSQQLPRDGTYFLIVTRFGQARGLTTGSYSLTLAHAGLVDTGSGAALQYGDSVVDNLDQTKFQQIYAFHATRGDYINASMQRISGDLDSYLILADSQGNILATNDEDPASPGTLDAALADLRIEKTGDYVLVATRFGRDAGTSRGGYSLTLDRLPPDSLGKVPEKPILIDYGQTVTGTIDPNHLLRFYLIEATKGDVISIDAERTRGNLDPILTLYTSDLKSLTDHDSGLRGQSAKISAFTAPTTGNYILMISRFNRDKGITAGDYSLSIVGRSGATVGSGGKLTLRYGSAANAIINDSNVSQQYTFAGTAGDTITVTMDVKSGNLLARLVLLDPNKKSIAQDDPGTGGADLTKVKLPATGNYTIVATRRGGDKGTTQGGYLLTLSQVK